jgi:hypothetical protein
MARSRSRSRSTSKLKTMRGVSAVLALAVAVLVAVGINQMRHWNILTGWELIGWALVPMTLLISFTIPVTCKVVRTNGLACQNWAYGLLFGCGKVPTHRWKKFRARLQFPERVVEPVGRPKSADTYALNQPPTRQRQEIKVTVEDGRLGVCGFWISVVSMVATVIGVIVAVVH